MQTAYMLYTVIKKYGHTDDFIGHIGGDDFVFITTTDRYNEICKNFTSLFDKLMPFHYSGEDRKQGFIVARNRTHKVKNIPLMSVSIALVVRDSPSCIKNVIEINESVAEIKQYLKTIPGSKFMSDRRNRKEESKGPFIQAQNYGARVDLYKPLGQVLIEKGYLSAEQLDEGLVIHWKRGIVLGEVLKELGFVTEDKLRDALSTGNLLKP